MVQTVPWLKNANTSLVNYNVSVRGKADESSDIVGKLQKGNGVEIIGKSGSYVKVRTGNSSFDGWVRSSAVVTESQAKLDRVIAVAKSKWEQVTFGEQLDLILLTVQD
ncbi:SH3 domain protein [Peptostreptococcus anaerobius]|uniref:SH3 domain protein n=1 Tax=Peptostreptococcus anaerobius TaxID=1261 RepID=A0A379C776_9FIRM|nr:SH3 domain-containing protein [Peptostreptococcus anaerobius]SUB57979.1 SH3 domain protein [Peptostreptococcus anaerobius]